MLLSSVAGAIRRTAVTSKRVGRASKAKRAAAGVSKEENTLKLRVDGQRHAIRALEKVIGDLRGQLEGLKASRGGDGGGSRVVSPERRKGRAGSGSALRHR